MQRNPGEVEFHQAARAVCESLMPFVLENKKYRDADILERLTEPDRTIIYRVSWEDVHGRIQSNRAWHVQFNNVIGPDEDGLRFHPSVNHSVLKFLGFEQSRKTRFRGTGRMQLAAWWVGAAYNLVRMAKLPA